MGLPVCANYRPEQSAVLPVFRRGGQADNILKAAPGHLPILVFALNGKLLYS
jgi:hypothetical protein